MNRREALLGCLLGVALPRGAAAANDIGWNDLPDPALFPVEDPLHALTPRQRADLWRIIRLRDRLGGTSVTAAARPRLEVRHRTLILELSREGIDAEDIISGLPELERQKRRASLAVNPRLEGTVIRISGYAFPGLSGWDGRPVAYVVPEIGMCSHTPPPPPNMLLRTRIASGPEIDEDYVPVLITGRLLTEYSVEDVHVVDGMQRLVSTATVEDAHVSVLGAAEEFVPNHLAGN